MTFKNLNDLFAHIQKDISDTLEHEVAEEVKETMSEAVQTSVYDTYDPFVYTRRFNNGGLMCTNNMKSRVEGNTLTVTNETPLDNGRTDYSLTDIIVNGLGRQPFPRDFISQTEENLDITKNHVWVMKQGLKNRGYDVK